MHPLMHSHIVGFLKSQLKSRGWSKFVDKKKTSVLQLNNYGMFISMLQFESVKYAFI